MSSSLRKLLSVAAFALALRASAGFSLFYKPCHQDPERQQRRSAELQKIVAADQKEREDFTEKFKRMSPRQVMQMMSRDNDRRKRVGEIFAEGCFSGAQDYAAAALVLQHGEVPDHYMQTFLWAKRAVELGDTKQKLLMVQGLDRYLTHSGHKQLFATQAATLPGGKCYCLEPVEKSFPEARRVEYAKNLSDALAWVDTLNANTDCPPARECEKELKATPAGFVPGFW